MQEAWNGFVVEGMAMRMALTDSLSWREFDVQKLLVGLAQFRYTIHVGVGWAWARLPWARWRTEASLDPLLRWLAYDGWGFHDCLFRPQAYAVQAEAPGRIHGYARRVWDQGAGRCLWFCAKGEAQRVADVINAYESVRHSDLWSGIGLAAGYAGGVGEAALVRLRVCSSDHFPSLAQGLCFAAKARCASDCVPEHTRLACELLLQRTAESAAQMTDDALLQLPPDSAETPAFEHWRRRVQGACRPLPS